MYTTIYPNKYYLLIQPLYPYSNIWTFLFLTDGSTNGSNKRAIKISIRAQIRGGFYFHTSKKWCTDRFLVMLTGIFTHKSKLHFWSLGIADSCSFSPNVFSLAFLVHVHYFWFLSITDFCKFEFYWEN